MIDRIRNTSIFCHTLIRKINLTLCIKSNILKKRISLDRIVNIWLGFLVQIDDLRIASTFKIEDSIIIPSMLVVTDQKTLRIGRKSCLSCSGKSEENRCIFTIHICICRTMHGGNSLKRQIVIHHGEHPFFHLSAVPCVDNNLLTACDIKHNGRLRIQPKLFIIFHFRLGRIIYDEIWLELFKLLFRRLDKHIGNEMCLPCNFHNEADRHTGILVCSAECVHNVKLLSRKLIQGNLLYCLPRFLCSRMIIIFIFVRGPPYCIFGILINYNELVFRGTPGVLTSHNIDCAKLAHLSFFKPFQTRFCLLFE